MILWADVTPQLPSLSVSLGSRRKPVGGTITWETAVAFPNTPYPTITTADDPVSVFKVPPPTQEYPWFPSFVFFNIYALVHPVNGIVGQPEEGVWIGTSGGTDEGRKCAFGVMWKGLRGLLGLGDHDGGVGKRKVRFYVQGVTDRGVVLEWERCVYVDVEVDWDV
jgi:mannosyl-glycoprotein endo-beta-N-acetylglucosaminidase